MPDPLRIPGAKARTVRRPTQALLSDRSGATGLYFGLLATLLLGFVGLGIDVGVWYGARRQAQNAADSSAFSAAVALGAGSPDVAGEARAVARQYGFVHGVDGVAVFVNQPPVSGERLGDGRAIEVIIERPARRIFTRLFLQEAKAIRARAVGASGIGGSNACVVALDATASASALETGSADVNLVGCSLYANSSSPEAFALKGAARLTAQSINLVGGYSVGSNATLTTSSGVRTGQPLVADPYLDVPIPPYSGCTYNSASLTSGVYGSISGGPTVFCNGLRINSGVTVTLRPGVYIIDRGALQVNGGATLTGDGVTLVFTSSTGSGYATAQINGNSVVNLTAPSSGPTSGLIFYQDRRAPAGVTNSFNGGSSQLLRGAIYFPKQIVSFNGGSSTSADGCTQLLAAEVAFRGNSRLQLNCSGVGIRPAGAAATTLVE